MFGRGKYTVACVAVLALAGGADAWAQTALFYSEYGPVYQLRTADRDGSNDQLLFSYEELAIDAFVPWMQYLVVDPVAEKFYWTELYDGTGRIERANFDGTNRETVVGLGVYRAGGMAIDLKNQHLYWISDAFGIVRQNLDGTGQTTIVGPEFGNIWGLAAHFNGGKLYWIHDDGIVRANLDGSQIESIVPSTPQVWYDLDVDPVGERLYWITDEGIRSAALDGSDVQTVLVPSSFPTDIAIEQDEGRLYWHPALSTTLCSAYLDGTDVQCFTLDQSALSFALDTGYREPGLPAGSRAALIICTALMAAIGWVVLHNRPVTYRRLR